MISHPCCGYVCETEEQMTAHMKGDDCPELLRLRNEPARVVDIGGQRIIAGSPRAVEAYLKENPGGRVPRDD